MQIDLIPQTESKEQWRVVAGFPNYECSTEGRFKNRWSGRILGGSTVHNGYIHIGLCRDGKQITKLAHRLIAETFLTKPTPIHNDCNHKNKVRTDNRVANLEWMTRSQNNIHAKAKEKVPEIAFGIFTP